MRKTLLSLCLGAALLARPARADGAEGTTIKDPTLLASGITIATLGAVAATSGLVVVAILAPIASQLDFGLGSASRQDLSGYYQVGVPLLIIGALSIAGGIGMAMEGGRSVPRVAFAPFVSPRGASVGFVTTF